MASADASFLIEAWDTLAPNHKAAVRLLEKGGPIRLNGATLAEATTAIRRIAKARGLPGSETARVFVDAFLRLSGVRLDQSGAEAAWRRCMRDTRLSFSDAWVLEQAAANDEDVLSFDRDLLEAARRQAD